MTSSSSPMSKPDLRARVLALRALLGAVDGAVAADHLRLRLEETAFIPDDAVVGGYWPMRGELDVLPSLAAFRQRGCVTALPVVDQPRSPLKFLRWSVGDPLEDGRYGTRHPLAESDEVIPSVLLVPLLAFDRRGFRLGYGGGFYDQTLARLRAGGPVVAIGVAYAAQEVAEVPIEPHDEPMDVIVTDKETIRIGGSKENSGV